MGPIDLPKEDCPQAAIVEFRSASCKFSPPQAKVLRRDASCPPMIFRCNDSPGPIARVASRVSVQLYLDEDLGDSQSNLGDVHCNLVCCAQTAAVCDLMEVAGLL